MLFRRSVALVIAATSVFASAAYGQNAQPAQPAQPGQPARPGVQGQANPARHPMATEQSLAACLAIANQEEIALAKWASEKTKNNEVKEFTKMAIDDHQAFLKKLERFAPEARQTTLETASTQTQDQSRVQAAGGAQPQAAAQPQAGANPQQAGQIQQTAGQSSPRQAVDVVQLHRELAQQCLADTKKKLGEKEGDKFDACFMGLQIGKHAAMKSTLTVFQKHASGEFAQVIADGLKTTENHLQEAEKIMQELEGGKSAKRDSKSEK